MLWMLLAAALAQQVAPIEATTLSGDPVALPEALGAGPMVLLYGFKRTHSADFDSWQPALVELEQTGRARWLALPFVDVGKILRSIVGAAMNRSIDDATTRAHFAPVWASGDPTRAALGLEGDEEMAVVLVGQDGTVRHIARGPASPLKIDALVAALPAAEPMLEGGVDPQ